MIISRVKIPAVALGVALLAGCLNKKDSVVVLSAKLTDRREVNTAVPEEYSGLAAAGAGKSVWVVGKVKNEGTEEVRDVEIVFRCTEGIDTRVLVATIESIPPGETVTYKTRGYKSMYAVELIDEPPEIDYTE